MHIKLHLQLQPEMQKKTLGAAWMVGGGEGGGGGGGGRQRLLQLFIHHSDSQLYFNAKLPSLEYCTHLTASYTQSQSLHLSRTHLPLMQSRYPCNQLWGRVGLREKSLKHPTESLRSDRLFRLP